jgi:hypothetical protein
VSDDVLRSLILEEARRCRDRLLSRRRSFMDAPLKTAEKRQRVRESVRRRHRDKPEPVRRNLEDLAVGMLDVAEADGGGPWSRLGQYLSLEVVDDALEGTMTTVLAEAFWDAAERTLGGNAFAVLMTSAGAPPRWEPAWTVVDDRPPSPQDPPKSLEEAYLETSSIRLLSTLWYVLKLRFGAGFLEAFNAVPLGGSAMQPGPD